MKPIFSTSLSNGLNTLKENRSNIILSLVICLIIIYNAASSEPFCAIILNFAVPKQRVNLYATVCCTKRESSDGTTPPIISLNTSTRHSARESD